MRQFVLLLLVGVSLVSAGKKIACLGGSGTRPWENDNFYPEFLGEELGGDFKVTNNGRPMATVMDVSCKARPIRKEQVWQDAKNSNPDIVTINLGMNDSRECNWGHTGAGVYKQKYGEILQEIKGWPSKPKVYLLNLQPLYPPYPNQHEFDPKIVNDVLPGLHKEIASANGVTLIDTFNLLGGTGKTKQGMVMDDGGHANKEGHRAIAKMIADKLRSDGMAAAAAALTPSANLKVGEETTDLEKTAQVEEPKAETKEATKTETEAPKTEVEVTKTEETKAETEVAKTEETKVEETKTEVAKAEETKVEEAKVEETKVEEAKVEETKTETEVAKTEEAKVEETKTEEIKAETEVAKAEEAKVEETKAEETKTEETKTKETEAPQVETEAPKAETEATKTETEAPKAEAEAPKAETEATKTETEAPKTETKTETEAQKKTPTKVALQPL